MKVLLLEVVTQMTCKRLQIPEWVCEEHPDKPQGHDGCDGAGIMGCCALEHAVHLLDKERQKSRECARAHSMHVSALLVRIKELEG